MKKHCKNNVGMNSTTLMYTIRIHVKGVQPKTFVNVGVGMVQLHDMIPPWVKLLPILTSWTSAGVSISTRKIMISYLDKTCQYLSPVTILFLASFPNSFW